MHKRAGIAATAFLIAACSESVGPRQPAAPRAADVAAAGAGIVLDKFTGVMGETGIEIGQGFNPTNPHRGDAIVATFFWRGSTNSITKVFDHLSDGDNGAATRSEEHTSELQSHSDLVCRLLLEKKKKNRRI